MRLAFGEADRILGYLKIWASLPQQAAEEELLDRLFQIGEHARKPSCIYTHISPPLTIRKGRERLASALTSQSDAPMPKSMYFRTFGDDDREEELALIPVIPLTPPPAPATPITPSNADDVATPAKITRTRSKTFMNGGL